VRTLLTRSAMELRELVVSGEASAVEVTSVHLERIHDTDDRVGALPIGFQRLGPKALCVHARIISLQANLRQLLQPSEPAYRPE
jgi:Asp-tRNA(Asn)/Glu-tRNA(Gln) amidotransferase A subunit family amidase